MTFSIRPLLNAALFTLTSSQVDTEAGFSAIPQTLGSNSGTLRKELWV